MIFFVCDITGFVCFVFEEDCAFLHLKEPHHFGVLPLNSAMLFFLRTRDVGVVNSPWDHIYNKLLSYVLLILLNYPSHFELQFPVSCDSQFSVCFCYCFGWLFSFSLGSLVFASWSLFSVMAGSYLFVLLTLCVFQLFQLFVTILFHIKVFLVLSVHRYICFYMKTLPQNGLKLCSCISPLFAIVRLMKNILNIKSCTSIRLTSKYHKICQMH